MRYELSSTSSVSATTMRETLKRWAEMVAAATEAGQEASMSFRSNPEADTLSLQVYGQMSVEGIEEGIHVTEE